MSPSAQLIETKIIQALTTGPQPTVIRTAEICLEDIRQDLHLRPLLDAADMLRQLVGRTVERVEWKHREKQDYIGHFEIYLRP